MLVDLIFAVGPPVHSLARRDRRTDRGRSASDEAVGRDRAFLAKRRPDGDAFVSGEEGQVSSTLISRCRFRCIARADIGRLARDELGDSLRRPWIVSSVDRPAVLFERHGPRINLTRDHGEHALPRRQRIGKGYSEQELAN